MAARTCLRQSLLGAEVMERARTSGHRPFLGQLQDGSEAPVVLCSLCGSYSETGLRGSIANRVPCKGRMSKGSAHRAARFARGFHPKRKEAIDGPWPGIPAMQVLCGLAGSSWAEVPGGVRLAVC